MEVKVTEKEILSNSNDYELGKLVRKRYWDQNEQEIMKNPDEHVGLVIAEDGSVKKIIRAQEMNQTCSICGESTYMISSEHLIGTNHIECAIKQDNEYDSCVICGKVSSYKRSTPIDLRIGYVEGAGQTCDRTCRK
jgi:hypothetical protein